MQWALHNQQHSPSYPSHYPAQAYQNSQTQSPAYYESYHYATTNHPPPPSAPQITYHPALPQITYPTPSNTNANHLKAEPNPLLPPPPQLRNLRNKTRFFPPMAPYTQSPKVQTQTLKPKGSVEIIIAKLTMSPSKVPLPIPNGLTC
jgi:hypothetical protein